MVKIKITVNQLKIFYKKKPKRQAVKTKINFIILKVYIISLLQKIIY